MIKIVFHAMTGVYNLELFSSLQAGVHFRKIFSFAQSHLLKNYVLFYIQWYCWMQPGNILDLYYLWFSLTLPIKSTEKPLFYYLFCQNLHFFTICYTFGRMLHPYPQRPEYVLANKFFPVLRKYFFASEKSFFLVCRKII